MYFLYSIEFLRSPCEVSNTEYWPEKGRVGMPNVEFLIIFLKSRLSIFRAPDCVVGIYSLSQPGVCPLCRETAW